MKNDIVFVNNDGMDDLLGSGILPPAVQSFLLARGHTPYPHATEKMIEQADTPNVFILTVKCTTTGGQNYPIRVAVAACP